MEGAKEALKFQQFSSFVDFSFWHELTKRKLDEYRLSEEAVPLSGSFSTRGTSGQPAYLRVDSDSFTKAAGVSNCEGTLVNTNTIESFTGLDRKAIVERAAAQLSADLASGAAENDPSLLTRFAVITFADLKAYKFFYWFCFPTVTSYRATLSGPIQAASDVLNAAQTKQLQQQFGSRVAALVIVGADGQVAVSELKRGSGNEKVTLAVADGGTMDDHPGWSVRNVLQLLHAHWGVRSVRLLLMRDHLSDVSLMRCRVLDVELTAEATTSTAGGWEKDKNGASKPRMVNLASQMDPKKLLTTAVDLNLKLMK